MDDVKLIQIVDAALAEVTLRSGSHLVCRPGCTPCCTGAFAIHALDALRLQRGFAELEREMPGRAAAMRHRVNHYLGRVAATFPGNFEEGWLGETEMDRERFEDFANEEPCPVLDPAMGTCDLYAHRPMTCRVFGPPVRQEGGFGLCELCFTEASTEEITACELVPDPEGLEDALLAEAVLRVGHAGRTIVAMALRSPLPQLEPACREAASCC